MLKNFESLLEFKTKKQRLIVTCAHDEDVIEAIIMALKADLIQPILVGNKNEIEKIIKSKNVSLDLFEIINANSDQEAAYLSVEAIRNTKADFIMKGLIDTKVLLKEVVNKETGIRESNVLSHLTLLKFKNLNRLLFATDCGMLIAPNVEEKIAIIENALTLTKTLGYNQPLVGMVSAVEKENPKIVSTTEAIYVSKHFESRSDVIVEGPFAIDNLVSMQSVKHKGIKSKVAGKADILIFPNIEAGNVFYKTSVFLAGAQPAGIILGAKCPIVLTSRADSSISKYYSIILAAVYSYGKNNSSN